MNEENFIKMMQTLNSLTTSMESLTGTQNRILEVLEKEQVVERIETLEDTTEHNTKRIEELEKKMEEKDKKRDSNDWNNIVEGENERRKKKVILVEKKGEQEKIVGKESYKEKLMKELENDAKVIFIEESKREEETENTREEILEKSKKILGFKPITKENVEYFMVEGMERKMAEREAIREFMRYFLRMEKEDIENIEILKTKFNRKGDILYAQMNEYTVLDLFRRGGSARNKEFSLVPFVPPQIFRRYRAAQELC